MGKKKIVSGNPPVESSTKKIVSEISPERTKRQTELLEFQNVKTCGAELTTRRGGTNVRKNNNARDIYSTEETKNEPDKKASQKRAEYIAALNR
jgi:hypothetical protein